MDNIGPLAVIIGGILAASGFIIAKKPNAKELLDKIVPYQGFLGVFLLAWGLYDLFRIGPGTMLDLMKINALLGIATMAYVASEILLGFLLGFGMIAKWIPGEGSAETKALDMQKKLMSFSAPIGAIGIVSAVIVLLFIHGVLKII